MANTFDRRPTRVQLSTTESVQRLVRNALDAPGTRNTRFVDATGAVQLEDDDVFGDTTNGTLTLTLPPVGRASDRTFICGRWKGANTLTVSFDGTDTMADGSTTVSLTSVGQVTRLKAVKLPAGGSAWLAV